MTFLLIILAQPFILVKSVLLEKTERMFGFLFARCFLARGLDDTDKNDGYVVDGFEISYIGNPFC